MTEICIKPAEIQDGDLMAYVDGIADEVVVEHVRRCRFCTQQVEDLARLQLALAPTFYRHSCPTSEQLTDYREGEIRASQRLVIAQHLRQCPHCARELATLSHVERTSRAAWLRAAIEVVEAILVTPQVATAGVRSVSDRTQAVPQVYRADEVEAILSQHPARAHPRQQDLVGLVHVAGQVPATIGEATVELYHGDGLIAVEQISVRGQFTLAALEPGKYDISLIWGSREIQLRGIEVR